MKKHTIKIVLITIAFISASMLAQKVSAENAPKGTVPPFEKPSYQTGPEYTDSDRDDPAKYAAASQDYFVRAVARVTNGFLGMVSAAALLMLIISGIQMLTAYGEEEKITNAKKTALWSIVGLVIAILAYAIVSIIVSLPFTVLSES